MPLPSTRVIHPDFAAHHAPVAAGRMTARCEVRDPAAFTEVFDRATGQTETVPGPPALAGRCSVQALSRADERADAVGQDVTTPGYRVELDFDAPAVGEGWQVRIVDADDDPQLADRTFTVQQVEYGTQRFTRVLLCDDE